MTVLINIFSQDNFPVAKVNEVVRINFTFDTNGAPETPNARLEALVIPDGIVENMSSSTGSKFVQAPDKKSGYVVSYTEDSKGWARNRYVNLKFKSLPEGKGMYVVGTIYYYNSEGIIGPGIPLLVELDNLGDVLESSKV